MSSEEGTFAGVWAGRHHWVDDRHMRNVRRGIEQLGTQTDYLEQFKVWYAETALYRDWRELAGIPRFGGVPAQ